MQAIRFGWSRCLTCRYLSFSGRPAVPRLQALQGRLVQPPSIRPGPVWRTGGQAGASGAPVAMVLETSGQSGGRWWLNTRREACVVRRLSTSLGRRKPNRALPISAPCGSLRQPPASEEVGVGRLQAHTIPRGCHWRLSVETGSTSRCRPPLCLLPAQSVPRTRQRGSLRNPVRTPVLSTPASSPRAWFATLAYYYIVHIALGAALRNNVRCSSPSLSSLHRRDAQHAPDEL